MRSLKIIFTLSTVLLTTFAFADEDAQEVTPIQQVKNEAIEFKNLPSESVTGALSDYVSEEETLADLLTQKIKGPKLYPYQEGLAYVNGFLCHIGNYPRSIVYTVLEGPQYGLQTVTTNEGVFLYVNYDYQVEYTPFGQIFRHFYDDSKIITGSTQLIKFY